MKKSFKGFIACFMAALLMIPAFTGVFAESAPQQMTGELSDSLKQMQASDALEARQFIKRIDASGIRNGKTFEVPDTEVKDGVKLTDIVSIMVKLDAAPAARAFKSVSGEKAEAYRAQLLSAQQLAAERISGSLDVQVEITHNYSVLFNGFAFNGEYRLIEQINKLEGLHAFKAPEWDTPELFSTTSQVHAVEAWDLNYTGKGEIIAIIDTGCKVDHPAFSTEPANPKYDKLGIRGILSLTHAKNGAINEIYHSAKIPFGWNYEYGNSDVSHHYSDHGTHVAGIAAGNGGEIKGMAPDAQLAVMQVFKNGGGASFTTILPAIEDAYILGCASANLSLGSACGSEDFYDPIFGEILDLAVQGGLSLAMAAGNDGNAAWKNRWFDEGFDAYGINLAQNPDYGVVGSPSSWPHGISVAAVQNAKAKGLYVQPVGGDKFIYSEHNENMVKMADELGGQTLEYVMVPGVGADEDYEGIDVDGKVAFVKRGEISFVEKGYIAQDHGAAACIIYNNEAGILNMVPFGTLDESNQHLVHDGKEGKIPHIAVSMEAGEAFSANEDKHIFIGEEEAIAAAPGGDQPTNFSSWGTTATMAMKPEITAPGGAIYSSTDPAISGELYATWDGTSMATPHIAGGMAVIRQLVDEKFPTLSLAAKHNLVNSILMCTANPINDAGGYYASPRSQGAGEMNLLNAVTTNAYITAEGTQGSRPSIELGDDPEKTGVYELKFTIHNFGSYDLTYTVEPTVLLDDITGLFNHPVTQKIVAGYTGCSVALADDEFTADIPESIQVPAGGEKEVTLTLTLTDDIKEDYLDTYYTSGAHIEGFLAVKPNEERTALLGDINENGVVEVVDSLLIQRYAMGLIDLPCPEIGDVSQDGGVTMIDATLAARMALQLIPTSEGQVPTYQPTLNAPFMGFYGDWNFARTVDDGYYYEDVPLNSNNWCNLIGYKHGNYLDPLGFNPFVETENMSYYLKDRNAISPNNDKSFDTVNLMYMGLMRNSYVRYVVLDPDGKEIDTIRPPELDSYGIYDTNDLGVCTKGYLAGNVRDQLGVNYGQFPTDWDYEQYGDDFIIRIEAALDNDGRHTTHRFTPEASECWCWDIPVSIDKTAPVIVADTVTEAEGKLTFSVTDEHYVAYVGVYALTEDFAIGDVIEDTGVFEDERGAETQLELATNEGEPVVIMLGDYAANISGYLYYNGELRPLEVGPEPEPEGNFEDCVIYNYGLNLTQKQWTMFRTVALADLYNGEAAPSNIEEFDGAGYDSEKDIVYAVEEGQLVKYDGISRQNGHLGEKTVIGPVVDEDGAPVQFNEMAFANGNDMLFGVSGAVDLYSIDTETGVCTLAAPIRTGVMAMDFGEDDMFYFVDAFGVFHSADLFGTGEVTDIVDLGVGVLTPEGQFYTQSGCIYGNTFYWGSIDNTQVKDLIRIDVTNGAYEGLGVVLQAPGLQMAGMFAVEDFIS